VRELVIIYVIVIKLRVHTEKRRHRIHLLRVYKNVLSLHRDVQTPNRERKCADTIGTVLVVAGSGQVAIFNAKI